MKKMKYFQVTWLKCKLGIALVRCTILNYVGVVMTDSLGTHFPLLIIAR